MLNDRLMGLRKKELICLAAGSGCSKTTFVKEVAYHLMQSGQKVGLIIGRGTKTNLVRFGWCASQQEPAD